jgi:hypothetical protein
MLWATVDRGNETSNNDDGDSSSFIDDFSLSDSGSDNNDTGNLDFSVFYQR